MNPIKKFIESNRQSGTTTALIEAMKQTPNSVLIVYNQDRRSYLIKNHKDLAGRIITLWEIQLEKNRGNKYGPIFFDTDAVSCLVTKFPDGYYSSLPTDTVNLLDIKTDGYYSSMPTDGYGSENHTQQLNIKLTKEDMQNIDEVNKSFFYNEISKSTLGRILIRKGIEFFNKK